MELNLVLANCGKHSYYLLMPDLEKKERKEKQKEKSPLWG